MICQEKSGFCFLKNKNDVFSNFKKWKALIENQTNKKIKRLRTDNGLEFCEGQFNEFCENEGIVRHRIVWKTPQQNGVAECMNRTLLERARCMLSTANLSKDFWAEAINMACYLVNRYPSTAIECKTPVEVWFGTPTDYSIYEYLVVLHMLILVMESLREGTKVYISWICVGGERLHPGS